MNGFFKTARNPTKKSTLACLYVINQSSIKNLRKKLGKVVHVFNTSTQTKAGRVRGQPDLQSKVQDSQDYTDKLCLEKARTKNKNQTKDFKKPKVYFGSTLKKKP